MLPLPSHLIYHISQYPIHKISYWCDIIIRQKLCLHMGIFHNLHFHKIIQPTLPDTKSRHYLRLRRRTTILDPHPQPNKSCLLYLFPSLHPQTTQQPHRQSTRSDNVTQSHHRYLRQISRTDT